MTSDVQEKLLKPFIPVLAEENILVEKNDDKLFLKFNNVLKKMEFAQWRVNCAEKTEEKVLKTIDKIMEDSNGRLYSQDLDDIKDCWEILGEIHPNMHMDK